MKKIKALPKSELITDTPVEFYKNVFGLHVIMDFGANKTLTGGLALQTLETWQEFIGTDTVL